MAVLVWKQLISNATCSFRSSFLPFCGTRVFSKNWYFLRGRVCAARLLLFVFRSSLDTPPQSLWEVLQITSEYIGSGISQTCSCIICLIDHLGHDRLSSHSNTRPDYVTAESADREERLEQFILLSINLPTWLIHPCIKTSVYLAPFVQKTKKYSAYYNVRPIKAASLVFKWVIN